MKYDVENLVGGMLGSGVWLGAWHALSVSLLPELESEVW